MNSVELTLIIPVYNREKLLPRTLHSVAAQTCRRFRLILVDNGSTDRSLRLCEAFRDEQTTAGGLDVTVLCEERPGATAARNRGLSLCTTPYVYFFDSDDELSPDFIGCLLPQLAERPDLVVLRTRMNIGKRMHVRSCVHRPSPSVHLLNSMLSTQSMVLRTDYVRACGGWDETLRIWNDWELGIRVLMGRPRVVWFTQRPFHQIHVHPDSLTGCSFSAKASALFQAMEAAWADVQTWQATDAERRRAQCAWVYRGALLCGWLRVEGSAELAARWWRRVEEETQGKKWQRRMARILCFYTAHGGRGAWRPACWALGL